MLTIEIKNYIIYISMLRIEYRSMLRLPWTPSCWSLAWLVSPPSLLIPTDGSHQLSTESKLPRKAKLSPEAKLSTDLKLSQKQKFNCCRCMEMVASQRADVTMLEAGDIYRAGKGWGLIPIMSEVHKLLCFHKILSFQRSKLSLDWISRCTTWAQTIWQGSPTTTL